MALLETRLPPSYHLWEVHCYHLQWFIWNKSQPGMRLKVQSPSADCAWVWNAASHLNGADFWVSQCFLHIAVLPTQKKQISLRTKTTITYSHCKVEISCTPCSDQWSFTFKLSRLVQVNNFPILYLLIIIPLSRHPYYFHY